MLRRTCVKKRLPSARDRYLGLLLTPPAVPLMATLAGRATGRAKKVKFAVAAPAGTVTDAGTTYCSHYSCRYWLTTFPCCRMIAPLTEISDDPSIAVFTDLMVRSAPPWACSRCPAYKLNSVPAVTFMFFWL